MGAGWTAALPPQTFKEKEKRMKEQERYLLEERVRNFLGSLGNLNWVPKREILEEISAARKGWLRQLLEEINFVLFDGGPSIFGWKVAQALFERQDEDKEEEEDDELKK